MIGLIDNMIAARNRVGSQIGEISLAGNTHKLQKSIPVITKCYVMFSVKNKKKNIACMFNLSSKFRANRRNLRSSEKKM